MVKNRLARLEKAVGKMGGGVCHLCWGHPLATIAVMRESDPNGPGFRNTGEAYLLESEDRITDDLRCPQCGTEAIQLRLMTIVGGNRKQAGRLVHIT